MRALLVSVLLLVLMAGCASAQDGAATQALAGTSWTATARGSEPRFSLAELQFGPKLSPLGMGEVRIAPGPHEVTWFSVRDGVLMMRLYGSTSIFVYEIKGDVLRLRHLSRLGETLGTQSFTRAPGVSFFE